MARQEGRDEGRSLAQWFCLLIGPGLILVGALGFLAESRFDTASGGDPGALDGHDFLIFEVNGWHNLVHLGSGLFLLVCAFRHASARFAALSFGAIYAVVSVVGLIDGKDVFGLFPVDKQDNVLHIVLAVVAIVVGLLSTRNRRESVYDTRPGSGAVSAASVDGGGAGEAAGVRRG